MYLYAYLHIDAVCRWSVNNESEITWSEIVMF